MTEVEIVIAFSVVAIAFVWLTVRSTTKTKTKVADDITFSQTVVAKLIQLYGTPVVVNGMNVIVLPTALQQSIDEFLTR